VSDQSDIVEQHQIRREKRARMIGTSREPYPVDMSRTHTLAQVRAGWPDLAAGAETDDIVEIGGRVVFLRNTGKLCFATLQDGFDPDSDGQRLQVMVSLAEVGEQGLGEWKADVDLGDFIWVRGRVVSSRRGELSVMASEWKMASKALRPLPVLHKDLSEEARVRRRYADLIVRPEAREIVRVRAAITKSLRRTLDEAELRLACAFLFTMPGVPFLYYGDEIGMRYVEGLVSKEGGYDRTGSRTPMQWDEGLNLGFSEARADQLYLPVDASSDAPTVEGQRHVATSLWRTVQSVLRLRHATADLQADAPFAVVYAQKGASPFIYRRGGLLLAVNPRGTPATAPVDMTGEVVYLLGEQPVRQPGTTVMAPQSFIIVRP